MRAEAPLLDAPPLIRYGEVPSLEYGAQPAVATAFIQAIEGRYYTRLVTVFCRLVTDANVADRQVFIDYRDAADARYAIAGAPVTQAASTTTDYAFQAFVGQSDWPVDDTVLVTLPPVILLPTHDFRIGIDNVQAADQLSQVRFVWERFWTGAPPS